MPLASGVDPKQHVRVVSAGGVNSGLFQAMAKTLDGDMGGLKFQLDNARKDLRYYTHFTERMPLTGWMGEAWWRNWLRRLSECMA